MTVPVSPKRTALLTAARERIPVLDGAMGTMIQGLQYDEAAFRRERFADFHRDVRGNNDLSILTQPKAIEDIHADYLRARLSPIRLSRARVDGFARGRLGRASFPGGYSATEGKMMNQLDMTGFADLTHEEEIEGINRRLAAIEGRLMHLQMIGTWLFVGLLAAYVAILAVALRGVH
jgi:Homocysteine S-methyltransferase